MGFLFYPMDNDYTTFPESKIKIVFEEGSKIKILGLKRVGRLFVDIKGEFS